MSRWFITLICLLALTVGGFAELDDLDAILAGLGDAPAAEAAPPAAVEDPFADLVAGAAEEAPPEAEVEDPFADLFDDFDVEPAVAAEPPAPVEDPFADLVAGFGEEAPAEADGEDPFADLFDDFDAEPAEAAEPLVDEETDPLADFMDDDWDLEPVDVPEIDDPFADLLEATPEAVPLEDEIEPLDDLLEDWEDEELFEEIPAPELPEEEEILDDFEVTPMVEEDEEVLDAEVADAVDADEEAGEATVEKPKRAKADKKAKAEKAEKAEPKVDEAKAPESKPALTPKVADSAPEWSEPVLW